MQQVEGDEVFGEAFGSFAEFALVPLKDLVKKPSSLDWKVAAALPMPALGRLPMDTAACWRSRAR